MDEKYENNLDITGYDPIISEPGPIPKAGWYIILCELGERFAFYGTSVLFPTYILNYLQQSKPVVSAFMAIFLFLAYLTTIVGAIIAETCWGKFKAIFFFAIIYIAGLILLLVSSIPQSIINGLGLPGFCIAVFILIACGTGGIKSNVSAFAAEQIPHNGIYDYNLTIERLFRYLYWAINIGAFFGMFLCSIIMHNLKSPPAAFGLSVGVFLVTIFLFLYGRKSYYEKVVEENAILKAVSCIRYALYHRSDTYVHWLDGSYINPKYSVEYVDGLKQTIKSCRVFLFFIIYWALYNNMTYAFIIQGTNMSRPNWLGAEQLFMVNSLVLIFILPIFDSYIFPFLRKRGFKLGLITRITIGFTICTIAFIYVTILQSIVYKSGPYYDFSNIQLKKGDLHPVNNISIWWQIPPYTLIAISEIFVSATGLEYAFKYASPDLKSVVLALFLLTNCGGSLISLLLSIWSYDPLYTIVFATQTTAMGIFTILFYFYFRKQDD